MGAPGRAAARWTMAALADLDLLAVVASHGWYQLAPFRWSAADQTLSGVLRTVSARPLAVGLRQAPGGVRIACGRPVPGRVRRRVEDRVGRMLALDQELQAFHAHCRRHAGLRWIPRRRLGRFLRGEDAFEDLVKVLLTTNCTWRQTVSMVERLVARLGPDGGAFPDPDAVAREGASGLRRGVRVGYRAAPLAELARRARDCGLEHLPGLGDAELARNLLALPGFGPYAAASTLLLWGRSDAQVVDSWALARARERFGAASGTAAALRRRYARHAPFRGLVAWFDLNRASYRRFPPDWLLR